MVFKSKWKNQFVLFRYGTEGSLDSTDVKILDLQNTRLNRPGMELSYFFCSSTSPQQRKSHFEDLLKLYYDCFFEELKNLGDDSEPFFTLEDLQEEYNECFAFGFILGCMHAQVKKLNSLLFKILFWVVANYIFEYDLHVIIWKKFEVLQFAFWRTIFQTTFTNKCN